MLRVLRVFVQTLSSILFCVLIIWFSVQESPQDFLPNHGPEDKVSDHGARYGTEIRNCWSDDLPFLSGAPADEPSKPDDRNGKDKPKDSGEDAIEQICFDVWLVRVIHFHFFFFRHRTVQISGAVSCVRWICLVRTRLCLCQLRCCPLAPTKQFDQA